MHGNHAGATPTRTATMGGDAAARWAAPQACMLEEVAALLRSGALRQPVERFPLACVHDALARAAEGGRVGKVLLTMTDTP